MYKAIPRFNPDPEDIDEGKAWIKMDDIMHWVYSVGKKDRATVQTKLFPPPPPSSPSPPPAEVGLECSVPERQSRWADNGESAMHRMSDIHHTNMTTRFISDLRCNYNTRFDTHHWNSVEWNKIHDKVYQASGANGSGKFLTWRGLKYCSSTSVIPISKIPFRSVRLAASSIRRTR